MNTWRCWEGHVPQGDMHPHIHPFPCCVHFFHLAAFQLYRYNELLTLSAVSSWVLWFILADYHALEAGQKNPHFMVDQ